MPTRIPALVAILAVGALALAGCNAVTELDPTGTPNTIATATPEPTTAPTTTAPTTTEPATASVDLPADWADVTVTAASEGDVVSVALSDAGWEAYRSASARAFADTAWPLVVADVEQTAGGGIADTDAMRQQFDCHVLGAWLADKRTWNLESWRASEPDWMSRIGRTDTLDDVCNW